MENDIVEDQVQDVSEQTSDTSEQSETTDVGSEVESKTYNVLGREMSSDELYGEYTKTQSHITKLQQEAAAREAKVQDEAATAVSESELLQEYPSEVKEAVKQIVTPIIQDALTQRDAAAEKQASDMALKQSFDDAEAKHDGKDGYPKFDRTAATDYMLKNQVYDPEKAYLLMNQAAIIDAEVRKALKGGGKASTESTAGSTPKKPEGQAPKSWEEASKRAVSRI